MELYYSFSVLIVLTAIFSYLNLRYLKLPSAIGIMLLAMIVSISLVIAGKSYPDMFTGFTDIIASVDFTEVLMGSMLNFLLFAGAIHISLHDLRKQRIPVMIFSTIGVIISTFTVGTILYFTFIVLGVTIPFIECLVFGALISPTDPIAVIGILKKAGIRKSLEIKVAGESLFNDGVAVVLFAVLLQLARGSEVDLTFLHISGLFLQEAGGGLLMGLLLGFIASQGIKRINSYNVTVMITLAVVMGGYLVTRALHISGPLTMVAAGLVIGNYGKAVAMSVADKDYLDKFWELIDEILNAMLFLIIGFELLLIPNLQQYWLIGPLTILIVLLARFFSIWLPIKFVPNIGSFDARTITILVWGGLRGGVSVALALTIDDHLHHNLFMAITYYVVVFSIVVQGLTVGKLTQMQKANKRVK
ncbi:MAG TPA: sodium:proton antiporter [Cyclobacteriaceae bacterium]|nr:sodium:proton antiporter [Cyclobacteriaceae bacterium]HMV09857.1 sodium:proton antiporter [Cyclobacteriaceae bacterium]HMV88683.1 sodium:proton antiporter [Cyclobacteriaceae bacterium]HMW99594.1 sodium:proton antiporter [Cyclobacteriaceae bacterium]HMX51028.1 sodium:proton antiporter [Cyclobacteriaceae bacterium]